MEAGALSKPFWKFGPFEVDARSRELRLRGKRTRIQDNPLTVLLVLLERKGEVVTREELKQRLWPADTFVEADDGLNTAIRKLREVLGDSSESPTYIETIPRRGYRFIGEILSDEEPSGASPTESAVTANPELRKTSLRSWGAMAAIFAGTLTVGTAAWVRFHPRPAPIRSIAVLPFANLSGDSSQDYFADAMTEELTSDLAKISALRVISRTSAMHYKKLQKTAPEIAKELNVDGLIESSVVRSGDRLRITAQLIDARSDRHLWSESYQRDLKDVLTLQSELAHTIAGEVQAAISPAEEARLRPQPVNPAAYDSYLLGRSHLEKWTVSGAGEALRYFQHAIEIDDHFALAYIGTAECYLSFMGVNDVTFGEGLDRGMLAIDRAIELNPEMGEAHAMLGALRMERDWDFAGAEVEMRKGISLNPGYGAAHHWYSHLLMYVGRYDEAMTEAQKMLELDPLSPAANLHMGYAYRAIRDWDRAIEQQRKTIQIDPGYVDAHADLGEDYLGKGMYPEAVTELRQAANLVRSERDYPFYAGSLGFALAKSGATTEAKKILAQIPRDRPEFASFIYSGLGDRDKALEMLNEAYRGHSVPLDAGFIMEFDPLHTDPRFSELLRRVGLR